MTTTVTRHWPASKLPADLSEDLDADALLTIQTAMEQPAAPRPTLEEVDIISALRRQRDAWE